VTLFELLIVLVMIGILVGIAASRLDWGRYRADGVSRGVLAELSGAQRLAVSLQENVVISLPDSARMQVHEDRDNDGSVGGDERVRMIVLDHMYKFGRASIPDTPAPSDPTALTTLTFRRDGSANRSGTFYLSGPEADPSCRHCRAIAINRATGRAVIYSYATGAWKRMN
jgi:Tfp pilus assembly protein FimT